MSHQQVSRRFVLKAASGIGVGLAAGMAAGPAASGTFGDVRAFGGAWKGAYDGRKARLSVVALAQPPSSLFTLLFTFTDEDRNQTFTGNVQNVPRDAHEIHGITLTGPATLSWPILTLHTWNTDYLSGLSLWGGTRYPMAFYRSAIAPPYAPARPFTGYTDWFGPQAGTGVYRGFLDGRPARLDVTPDRSQPRPVVQFTLTDLDRDVVRSQGVFEDLMRDGRIVSPRDPLAGLPLSTRPPGADVLTVDSLAMHSWNCSYVSGVHLWQNNRYGMSFIRQTPIPT